MELMLRDGDYLPDGTGGVRRAEGSDGLLQRVLWKLTARRGSFPFLPELGSQLHRLPRCRTSQRQGLAEQYVAEALAGEDGLSIESVELAGDGDRALLTVRLTWNGTGLTAAVALDG